MKKHVTKEQRSMLLRSKETRYSGAEQKGTLLRSKEARLQLLSSSAEKYVTQE